MNKKDLFFTILLLFLFVESNAYAEIVFSTDMNSSSNSYGFGYTHSSDNYNLNFTNDGYNSTGAAHIVIRQDTSQYQFGFAHPGPKPGGWTWDDVAYVRFRIKFDDNFRWDGTGSQQNKMIDIGGGENARVILHNERDRPSEPCALNYTEYPSSGPVTYNTAQDYGLPPDAFSTGNYGSLALKNGIWFPCTPPVVITHGVWYHVQFAVKISSASGQPDGYFKLWVNNNDYTNPSTEVMNIIRELGELDEWNADWDVGGYWTSHNPYRDQGWILDDYQTATTFDPNWAPANAAIVWTLGTSPNTVSVDNFLKQSQPRWLSVNLSEEMSGSSVLLSQLLSYNGGDTASLRLRNLSSTNVDLLLEEEKSADTETGHIDEDVGLLGLREGYILDSQGNTIGEAGLVTANTTSGSSWSTLNFTRTYTNPVVLMGMITYNGGQPAHIRLKNVTTTGAQYQIEEWDYLDGAHTTETMGYVVVEQGSRILQDGKSIQAGVTQVNHTWADVGFEDWGGNPVAFTQSQTYNGGQAIVTRQANLQSNGFQVRLQEEEANDGTHAVETVGYIVIQ